MFKRAKKAKSLSTYCLSFVSFFASLACIFASNEVHVVVLMYENLFFGLHRKLLSRHKHTITQLPLSLPPVSFWILLSWFPALILYLDSLLCFAFVLLFSFFCVSLSLVCFSTCIVWLFLCFLSLHLFVFLLSFFFVVFSFCVYIMISLQTCFLRSLSSVCSVYSCSVVSLLFVF